MTHWSMLPGAEELTLRTTYHGTMKDIKCSCDRGKNYVEGEWPIHGWSFHAGQCCDCMNIRVYYNGAEPADWDDPAKVEFAEENSEEIHICDLDRFIEALEAIRDLRNGT